MPFDRQPLTPQRKRRAMQQLAIGGQADGVSMDFANGLYSVNVATSGALAIAGGVHVLTDNATIKINGSNQLFAPVFVGSGSTHAAGIVPDPGASAGTTKYLREDGTWTVPPTPIGTGTVTSVGLALPGIFTVTGTPVTTTGTLTGALATQTKNLVFAGPTSGSAAAPTFRALGTTDLPTLYAFRNRVINGGMRLWQRGTTFSTASKYTADRWKIGSFGNGSGTISRQAMGATDPPQGASYFPYSLQWAQSGSSSSGTPYLDQPVEGVSTLQGQTVTLSLWAKCASGTVAANLQLYQDFGSGGSPSTGVTTGPQAITITTTWQRFTWNVAVPSISGKTLGSNGDDCLHVEVLFPLSSTYTVNIVGVQLEPGDVSDFEFRHPTLELLLCQRYYERSYAANQANGAASALGPCIAPNIISSLAASTGGNVGNCSFLGFKVEKRATPTVVLYGYGGTANSVHMNATNSESGGAGTQDTDRGGATIGPINAAGALQYITFDNSSSAVVYAGGSVYAHWTAEAEL